MVIQITIVIMYMAYKALRILLLRLFYVQLSSLAERNKWCGSFAKPHVNPIQQYKLHTEKSTMAIILTNPLAP